MSTTASVNVSATASIAVGGCWGPTTSTSNPTNATTTMVGGKVQFENDNYRITMGDNNEVIIKNKNTGEEYKAWGDPHMNIDGKHAFDFWGDTTFHLDDGTKVTIQTTPWGNNPNATLSSKVTITNGDYGVHVTGVDTNTVGDLKFNETTANGEILDLLVNDGNTLYENPAGKGFVGFDTEGNLRAVDQKFINETDLLKGGAQLQNQFGAAFQLFAGLVAITFVGAFLSAVMRALERGRDLGPDVPRPDVRPPVTPDIPRPDVGAPVFLDPPNAPAEMWAGGSPGGLQLEMGGTLRADVDVSFRLALTRDRRRDDFALAA